MSSAADPQALEERWRRVLAAGSGLFNLVDAEHPLRLYIGGNSLADPTLTVVLSERPPTLAKFNLLTIETRQRDDGTWLLLLQLESVRALREFVTMCGDLITASRDCSTEVDGLKAFLTALDHWRNLFKPALDDLLTESELRGLAAELICMSRVIRPSRSWGDVMQGWVGPVQAPQDFRLSGGVLVEVKAIHRDSQHVRIASLEQLDRGSSTLYLLTVVVERDVPETPGVFTLPGLVREIESDLGGSLDLLDEFRGKLREARFAVDEPEYEQLHFWLGTASMFEVGTTFPALTRSTVSGDVLRAEYDLGLAGLGAYACEIGKVFPGDSWN